MNKLSIISISLLLVLILGGCRRHYQVNYVRVAEDTLIHNVDTAEETVPDETVYEIPKTPRVTTTRDILNSKNRDAAKEAERLFSGEDGYEEIPLEGEP